MKYVGGVVIGCFHLVVYMIILIFFSCHLMKTDPGSYTIQIIPIMLIYIVATCALLKGILKKREYLMVPWLILYVVGITVSFIFFYMFFITLLTFKTFRLQFCMLFVIGLLAIVFQMITFVLMCTLCHSVRKENIKKSKPILGKPEENSQTPPYRYTEVQNTV